MRKSIVLLGAGLLAAVSIAGCGSSGSDGAGAQSTAPSSAAAGPKTLTVFAAASLTESFGALGKSFEAANPGVTVKFSFAGSSALVQQIIQGAPADVFASADENNMAKATKATRVDGQPEVFATNKLTIAVAPGNPKGIKSFADLAKDGLTVITCAEQVPCGSATKKVETATGTTLKPASQEQDVKAVLTKVQAGEADAGLVYVSDAKAAAGKVQAVDFAEASNAINKYPIAVVAGSAQTALAKQFVDYVRSAAGQQELTKAGFGTP